MIIKMVSVILAFLSFQATASVDSTKPGDCQAIVVAGTTLAASAPSTPIAAHNDPIVELVRELRAKNPDNFDISKVLSNFPPKTDLVSHFKIFYRGFAQAGYTVESLIRNLQGERQFDIRSWEYSAALRDKLKTGLSENLAIAQTDMQMRNTIADGIKAMGKLKNENELFKNKELDDLTVWLYLNQLASLAMISGEKSGSTMVSFSTGIAAFPLNYSLINLFKTIKEKGGDLDSAVAVVLEVQEQNPRGVPSLQEALPFGNVEYQIFSHVPAADISGAYVGIPVTADSVDWYYLKVAARNPNHNLKRLEVYAAKTSAVSGGKDTLEQDKLLATFENGQPKAQNSQASSNPSFNKLLQQIQKYF